MTEVEIRAMASLASVLAVALIGVAFAIMDTSWRNFQKRYSNPSPDQRRETKFILWVSCEFLLWLFTSIAMGIIQPRLLQNPTLGYVLPGSLALALLATGFLTSRGKKKRRKKRKKKWKEKMRAELDMITPSLYLSSYVFLLVSMIAGSVALVGVSVTALSIELGPIQLRDFVSSALVLMGGILSFMAGIMGFVLGHVLDHSGDGKKGSKETKSFGV